MTSSFAREAIQASRTLGCPVGVESGAHEEKIVGTGKRVGSPQASTELN